MWVWPRVVTLASLLTALQNRSIRQVRLILLEVGPDMTVDLIAKWTTNAFAESLLSSPPLSASDRYTYGLVRRDLSPHFGVKKIWPVYMTFGTKGTKERLSEQKTMSSQSRTSA